MADLNSCFNIWNRTREGIQFEVVLSDVVTFLSNRTLNGRVKLTFTIHATGCRKISGGKKATSLYFFQYFSFSMIYTIYPSLSEPSRCRPMSVCARIFNETISLSIYRLLLPLLGNEWNELSTRRIRETLFLLVFYAFFFYFSLRLTRHAPPPEPQVFLTTRIATRK